MICWILLLVVSPNQQLETLLKAHESGVGLIHSLDMRLEHRQVSRNGVAAEKHISTWYWTKQGRRERQRYIEHTRKARDDGKARNLGDAFEDGTTIKVLSNYDWVDPQPLHPHKQGTVKAWFGPQDRVMPSPFPNPAGQFAMFQIQMNLEDPRKTLRELVRDSPKASVEGEKMIGSHKVWHLRIEHPDSKSGGKFAGSIYDVYLDPAVNYLVRKVFLDIKDLDPRPESVMPMQYEREAIDFKSLGNGVFIPVTVASRMYTPAFGKAPVMEMRTVAEEISVNEPLPKDAFDFRWPENSLVAQFPPKDNQLRVTLWGPNNQPAKEIKSQADLGPMPDELLATKETYSWPRITVIALSCLAIVAGLFMFFRRRAALAR